MKSNPCKWCRDVTCAVVLIAFWVCAPAEGWDTLPARTKDDPAFNYEPSPPHWRDMNIYQILTDRFFDSSGGGGSSDPNMPHGGNFAGITRKLDYLKMLGVKAIWISPVMDNRDGNYDGYSITDYNKIEPQFGALDDLRELIDEAHIRNIYVFLDVIPNHMADRIGYWDNATQAFTEKPPYNDKGYEVKWRDPDPAKQHAPPFHDLGRFHNFGEDEDVILGDILGMDDLKTETTSIQEDLLTIHKALIAATDCDGFRVSAVKHVDDIFWQAFLPAIKNQAEALGKNSFFLFGQVDDTDEKVGTYTQDEIGFPSMQYFPMQSTMKDVFAKSQPTKQLKAKADARSSHYSLDATSQLVTFLDDHDQSRFLSDVGGDLERLKVALTYLYTWDGIPLLYYGTEQGFKGVKKDHGNREDMFNGAATEGPSQGDNFNYTHPLFIYIRKLNLLREAYPALTHGTFTPRQSDSAAGVWIHSRQDSDNAEELFVVLNTSDEQKPAKTMTAYAKGPDENGSGGDELCNVFNVEDVIKVDAPTLPNFAGEVNLGMRQGYAHTIYVLKNRFVELPPTVISVEPSHDAWNIPTHSRITLDFDTPMDKTDPLAGNGLAKAFKLLDAAGNEVQCDAAFPDGFDYTRIVFTPRALLENNQKYTIKLEGSAKNAAGVELGSAFTSFFRTTIKPRQEVRCPRFYMDGKLDAGVPMIAESRVHSQGKKMTLYAKYDPACGDLYVATYDAGEENDHFIFVTDTLLAEADMVNAPLTKQDQAGAERYEGKVAASGPYLADYNDTSIPDGWQQLNTDIAGATSGPNGGFIEGYFNVEKQFKYIPDCVYLAVGPYYAIDKTDGKWHKRELVHTFQVPPTIEDSNPNNACAELDPKTGDWAGRWVETSSGSGTYEAPKRCIDIDPTEFVRFPLKPSDYYVRDWTVDSSDFDPGDGTKTMRAFWDCSDVWNSTKETAEFNSYNQPQSAFAESGRDNYAFVRISRVKRCSKEALPALGDPEQVVVEFYVSEFGTGSPFERLKCGNADVEAMLVTLEQADKDKVVSVRWQPQKSSCYRCIAVEIHTPSDPLLNGQSLLGKTPGALPGTDDLVRDDSNKAQRNMHLHNCPYSGEVGTTSEESFEVSGEVTLFALIHNGTPFPRDITLRSEPPPGVPTATNDPDIWMVDQPEVRFKPGGLITLSNMQPSENRWIGLTFRLPLERKEPCPVTFSEIRGDKVVNGFTMGLRPSPLSLFLAENVALHRSFLARLDASVGSGRARAAIVAISDLMDGQSISAENYIDLLRSQEKILASDAYETISRELPHDPFAVAPSMEALQEALEREDVPAAAVAHAAVLHKLDSFLTMLQKSRGDAACIMENVRWQIELCRHLPVLRQYDSDILHRSEQFAVDYEARIVTENDYPVLIRDSLAALGSVADELKEELPALKESTTEMARNLKSIASLQKAHSTYLQSLQSLVSQKGDQGSR